MRNIILVLLLMSSAILVSGQNVKVEGYVFEEDNRGYLNMAKVILTDKSSGFVFEDTYTDVEGHFVASIPAGIDVVVNVNKDMFEPMTSEFTSKEGNKEFLSFKMKRVPGYVFEITLAEKRDSANATVQAIKGARIEVYNNTTRKAELELIDYASHEFNLNLKKGNHYTLLVRKEGYLSKRMEAYVNVNGCILCFEGIGSLRPGVVDNLSNKNEIGVLLANVELERVYTDKLIGLNNIYYQLGKADLTAESLKELDKVALIAKDNPSIRFELGSHTDSRGSFGVNMELSHKRANAVVDYLVNKKDVRKSQLEPRGYGESSLVNKCSDNVVCSEAQHAKNRRTELKILSYDNATTIQSLVQIKAVEEFEAELFAELYKSEDKKPIEPTKTNLPKAASEVVTNTLSEEVVKAEPFMDVPPPSSRDIIEVNADSLYEKIEVNIDTKTIKATTNDMLIEDESHAPNIMKSDQQAVHDMEISTETSESSSSYMLKCGAFSNRINAVHLRNKVQLLGYPNAEIIVKNELFILVADVFYNGSYADEAKMHLMKNEVECFVEEVIK